jgi:hypothetical protein
MPTPRPKLSLVAEAGIQELRRDHGIEPTLDEIIWLHELGKAQEAAGRIDGILEAPAQAGDVFLWPITIMAAQWWRNYALPWFGTSPLFSSYALAFALAHGRGLTIPDTTRRGWAERIIRQLFDIRETRTLADLIDRRVAAKAIEQWASNSHATQQELEFAVDYVLAASDDEPDTVKDWRAVPIGVNYDDMVHELATCSGTDPDYWRGRTSQDATIRAYVNLAAIERARRGVSGPAPRDALGEAIKRFRLAMVAIIEAHKGNQ